MQTSRRMPGRQLAAALLAYVLAAGCATGRYTIESDGDLIASREANETTSHTVTTEYENPLLTGLLSASDLRFTTDSRGMPATCCRRLQLRASDNVFTAADLRRSTAAFLSVEPGSVGTAGDRPVYGYRVPAISMPADGSAVRLALHDGSERIAGSLRLAPHVLVLPVHVHVFTAPDRQIDTSIRRERVYAWFERPSFETRAVTIASGTTGAIETHIITEAIPDGLYHNVDDVWHQAGIQFRLENWNTIENAELERQVVDGHARSSPVSTVHHGNRHIPGIHIYVGRNSGRLGSGFGVFEGRTLGPTCTGFVSADHHIMLAWDVARRTPGWISYVLAHEIGHYLGLDHPDGGITACGSALVDDDSASNLMRSAASSPMISARQAEAARRIACAWLTSWGMPSSACAP